MDLTIPPVLEWDGGLEACFWMTALMAISLTTFCQPALVLPVLLLLLLLLLTLLEESVSLTAEALSAI